MWCSPWMPRATRDSDACLWHVSIVGGARRRGCAAAGVSGFFNGPLSRFERDLVGVVFGRAEAGGAEGFLANGVVVEVRVGRDDELRAVHRPGGRHPAVDGDRAVAPE